MRSYGNNSLVRLTLTAVTIVGMVAILLSALASTGSGAAADWTEPVKLSNVYSWSEYLPDLVVGPDNALHVVWQGGVSYSKNSSTWWSPTTSLGTSSLDRPASVAVSGQGRVFVAWTEPKTVDSVSYSEVRIRSWSSSRGWTPALTVSQSPGVFANDPVITADDTGIVHIAWVEGDPGTVKYRNWNGQWWGGEHEVWSSVETVSAHDWGSWHPSISVDADSTAPRIAWEESPSEYGGEHLILYRERSGGSWGTVRDVSASLPGGLYSMPKLTTDASGNSHLLVRILAGKLDLYYTHSEDAGITWAHAANLSGADGGHALNATIAVDTDGIVHAAWTRSSDMMASYGDSILYVNGSADSFSAPEPVPVPTGATEFHGVSLGSDALDRVHLVYDAYPRQPGVPIGAIFYTQMPRFLVTAPNGGETITGTTTVTAAGSGPGQTVNSVSFLYTDGILGDFIGSDSTPGDGWAASWNTTWTPAGDNYKVQAVGMDGSSQIVATDDSNNTFTIANSTVIPTLEIIKPDSTQSAHDRLGGSAVPLQARITGDTGSIVNKVVFYYHQNGGNWISLGQATQSGSDWNLNWNVSSFPDGDGYQVMVNAYHLDGGVNHLVATEFSNIFEVRNTPIISIWNQTGQVLGSGHYLYVRKDWDPNNRVSYVHLMETHSGLASHDMGNTMVAPSGNPCEAGGYSCHQYYWNMFDYDEADDYVITAEARNASHQPVDTTAKGPFIVQNTTLKFIKPAANSTISWPTEITVRPRDDISGISPASFYYQCGGGSRISLNTPDAGRPWSADFDPRTVASCTSLGLFTAEYTLGGNPYWTAVGGISTGPGFAPAVVVTPGSTDPVDPYFITAATILNATFTTGGNPVPASEILAARLTIDGTNGGMHVVQMSDDYFGDDGWSWTATNDSPDFVDGNYDAYIDIYWKASPAVPQRVWHGYYVVNRNVDHATVVTEMLPNFQQQMKDTYKFRYMVYNPDQISQTVTLSIRETGSANAIDNELGGNWTPLDYHDKVNGVVKSDLTQTWSQTATIPPGEYYTFEFSFRHDWDWLAPSTSDLLGATDIMFKANDIASWSAEAMASTVWKTRTSAIGYVGNAIQGGVMIAQVFTAGVAMDYHYEISSNIPSMAGLTSTDDVTCRVPNGKVGMLFESYTMGIAGSASTAMAAGAAACPPCSAALLVNEVVDWGIAVFAADAAGDPDPNYTTTARPDALVLPYMDTIAEGEGKEATRAAMDSYDTMNYLSETIARMEGAHDAGDVTWEARQLEVAISAAEDAKAKLEIQNQALQEFQDQLDSMGMDVTVDDVAQAQQNVKNTGSLPPEEVTMLTQMGKSPQEIENLEQGFLLADSEEVADEARISQHHDEMLEQFGEVTDELTHERDDIEERNYFFTWYDEKNPGMQDWILGANPSGAQAETEMDVFTAGIQRNPAPYVLAPGGIVTPHFPGVMEGPVKIVSRFGQSQIASQRILYGDSFEEVLGMDERRLSDHYYYTWYDELNPGSLNWILVANPSTSDSAEIEITISDPQNPAGDPLVQDHQMLAPGQIVTPHYPGIRGGPVEVIAYAPGDRNTPRQVLTSQRVLWQGRFNEVLGNPGNELSGEYVWTWYDESGPGINDWVLVANPNSYDIEAEIFIGSSVTPVWSTDGASGRPDAIQPGGIVTPRFPGTMDGPVTVRTWKNENLTVPAVSIVSQRSLWGASFEEVPGLPLTHLTASPNFSWYDQMSADSLNWVLVANPGDTTAKAEIWIAGVKRMTLDVAPGGRQMPTFPGVMNGPVEVRGYDASTYNPASPGQPNHSVMASQRVLWKGNFNEVLGVTLE